MKKFLKGFLITVFISLIITSSLVTGYLFFTKVSPAIKERFDEYTDPIVERINETFQEPEEPELALEPGDPEVPEDPQEQVTPDQPQEPDDPGEPQEPADNEPYTYQGYVKRDSGKPEIYQIYGYIFNSEGKVLDEYRKSSGSNLRFVKSIDGSEGVFTYNKQCIYVDSYLNTKVIAEDCIFSGINFEGGYIYYLKRGEDGHEVHIVDIAQDKDYLIAGGDNIFCVCISPDGRTLVYSYDSDMTTFHIKGIDTEEKVFETKNAHTAVSVSNDGETIFYYDDDDEPSYYCLDHGKSVKLGEKNIYKSYLDKECKQIVFIDDDEDIRYYRAGNKKSYVLVKGDDAYMNVGIAAVQQQDIYMQEYIVDTDSFSDVMMITKGYQVYCLRGSDPKADEMTKGGLEAHISSACVTQDGPCCIYKNETEIHKLSYEGDVLTDRVIYKSDNWISSYICSKDLSKIWVYSNKKLILVTQDASPVELADLQSGTISQLAYDHIDDVCYYCTNDTLWCVGETPESNQVVMEDCTYFFNTYEYTNVVYGKDRNNVSYIFIYKQPYREK